ncbi:MAG: hypothetical protein ABIF71_13500 [Planctomycetota bacterium]
MGIDVIANHHDGMHFLSGTLNVQFMRYPLGRGIKMGFWAPPELPPVVHALEDMCEQQ